MKGRIKTLSRLLILVALVGVNAAFASLDAKPRTTRATQCPTGGGAECWGNCDSHRCVNCTLPLCDCDEYTIC